MRGKRLEPLRTRRIAKIFIKLISLRGSCKMIIELKFSKKALRSLRALREINKEIYQQPWIFIPHS